MAADILYRVVAKFLRIEPTLPPLEIPLEAQQEKQQEGESQTLIVNTGQSLVHPFAVHLSQHFSGETSLTQTEIQERFMHSLEGLASEITNNVQAGEAWGEVIMEKEGEESYLLGHIHWDIDNYSPKVYAITMALLSDGFVYMAERNTYMITSKVVL